jgi:transposase-like protein
MHICPKCQQARYHVKDGFTSAGSQRIRCRACGYRYTPATKPLGYAEDVRRQALKMYVDGLNFRRIARLLGVHHQSVINWVNAAAARVPDVPPVPSQVETVEMDELYTFVQTKKKTSTS